MALRGLEYCFRLSDVARHWVSPHTSEGSLMEEPYVISNWIFLSCQPLEELIMITCKDSEVICLFRQSPWHSRAVRSALDKMHRHCISTTIIPYWIEERIILSSGCDFTLGAVWVVYSILTFLKLTPALKMCPVLWHNTIESIQASFQNQINYFSLINLQPKKHLEYKTQNHMSYMSICSCEISHEHRHMGLIFKACICLNKSLKPVAGQG